MSTSIQALGGHQKIAAAVTDLYAPTFKTTLVVSVHIRLYFIIKRIILHYKKGLVKLHFTFILRQ